MAACIGQEDGRIVTSGALHVRRREGEGDADLAVLLLRGCLQIGARRDHANDLVQFVKQCEAEKLVLLASEPEAVLPPQGKGLRYATADGLPDEVAESIGWVQVKEQECPRKESEVCLVLQACTLHEVPAISIIVGAEAVGDARGHAAELAKAVDQYLSLRNSTTAEWKVPSSWDSVFSMEDQLLNAGVF